MVKVQGGVGGTQAIHCLRCIRTSFTAESVRKLFAKPFAAKAFAPDACASGAKKRPATCALLHAGAVAVALAAAKAQEDAEQDGGDAPEGTPGSGGYTTLTAGSLGEATRPCGRRGDAPHRGRGRAHGQRVQRAQPGRWAPCNGGDPSQAERLGIA